MEKATGFEGVGESVMVVRRWVAKHLVEEEEAIFRGAGIDERTEQRVENVGFWICDELGVDLG